MNIDKIILWQTCRRFVVVVFVCLCLFFNIRIIRLEHGIMQCTFKTTTATDTESRYQCEPITESSLLLLVYWYVSDTSAVDTNAVSMDNPLLTWWRHAVGTLSTLLVPLWGESTGHGEFPSQGAVKCFLCVDKLLNKRSSYLLFQTPWSAYDVTVIWDLSRVSLYWGLRYLLSLPSVESGGWVSNFIHIKYGM